MLSRALIVTSVLVFLAISACSTNRNPQIDECASIGTHSLHILCIDHGSPTIVIDTDVTKFGNL